MVTQQDRFVRNQWLLGALLAVGFLPGCKSQAQTLCDLACDCQHCNDSTRDLVCVQTAATQDVAEAYGCESEWEKWASCVEDNGTCDEATATFSTRATGSCSAQRDVGACNADGTCLIPDTTCSNGRCLAKACPGETNTSTTCAADADCAVLGAGARCAEGTCRIPGGDLCQNDQQCGTEDHCQEQTGNLNKCQDDASTATNGGP